MSKSAYGIVFSNYMKTLIPGTNLIYHGSEPWPTAKDIIQKEAREEIRITSKRKVGISTRLLYIYKRMGYNKKYEDATELEIGS